MQEGEKRRESRDDLEEKLKSLAIEHQLACKHSVHSFLLMFTEDRQKKIKEDSFKYKCVESRAKRAKVVNTLISKLASSLKAEHLINLPSSVYRNAYDGIQLTTDVC